MDAGVDDQRFIQQALTAARESAAAEEVPVGAVAVANGRIVARAGNGPIGACDPTAHAEILVLRRAAAELGNYRLSDVTVFVTLEPCTMCVGALIHARVARLVFGAADPKSGAAGSVFDLATAPEHNHRMSVTGGVLAESCGDLLRTFFRDRRSGSP